MIDRTVSRRICTHCPTPHVTTDWYEIDELRHPCKGEIECADAHERRIPREVRGGVPSARHLVNSCSDSSARRGAGEVGAPKRRVDLRALYFGRA